MINLLLAADLHLTDNPVEEYRWKFFEHLIDTITKNSISHVYLLGDVWDRKDRHAGRLLNRFVEAIHTVKEKTGSLVSILAGNHDSPLEGVHYWQFLNKYDGIHYITQPEFHYNEVLILPFSSNPIRDWKDLPLENAQAFLMHQPVQGAFVDEYRKLEKAPPLPPLPNRPIFSGDIHNPQVLNNIVYIGVPHPVHFNEDWKHRVILIKNQQYKKYQEIFLPSIRRAILDITSASELDSSFKEGDQVRIRIKLDGKNLSSWPVEQQAVLDWAKEKGVYVASLEASIQGDSVKTDEKEVIEIMNPEQVLKQYGAQEKLSEDVIEMGLSFLRE